MFKYLQNSIQNSVERTSTFIKSLGKYHEQAILYCIYSFFILHLLILTHSLLHLLITYTIYSTITYTGPSKLSSLRSALLAGDEDKIISLYTTDKHGNPLPEIQIINPSTQFKINKKQNEMTPMHLAAYLG